VHPVRRGLSFPSLLSLEYWIFRRSAQLRTRRTMTTEYDCAFPRRVSPGRATKFSPKIERAQGMPGAGWHPRSRVQDALRNAHTSIQVQPKQPGTGLDRANHVEVAAENLSVLAAPLSAAFPTLPGRLGSTEQFVCYKPVITCAIDIEPCRDWPSTPTYDVIGT
jgi:hypothetical protein